VGCHIFFDAVDTVDAVDAMEAIVGFLTKIGNFRGIN
tara:strand:+ start:1771 stop:1881 length:111 start_codon:yes stop_codon:yes gene_type:complete